MNHPNTPGLRRHTIAELAATATFYVAGLLGVATGTVPAIHHWAVTLIGRGSDQAHAGVPWVALSVVTVLYSGLFLAFHRRLSPTHGASILSSRIWILALTAILFACWWPFRQDGFGIIYKNQVTVWSGDTVETKFDGEADVARRQFAGNDETRDVAAIELLARDGFSSFWESGKSSWARYHPPLGYILISPLHGRPVLLRGLSLALFCASLAAIAWWAFSIGGDSLMVLASLVMVSAPGLIQDFTFRLSLDVLIVLPGVIFGWLLFGPTSGTRSGLLTAPALMGTLVLTKFIAILAVPGTALALLRRRRKEAIALVAVSGTVFVLYHAIIIRSGIPFAATYPGDLLASFAGDGRSYQHGGHLRSLTTIFAFILSPLGFLLWVFGLGSSVITLLAGKPSRESGANQLQEAAPWFSITVVAVTLLILVVGIHPLLRYTAGGLWAVVLSISFGLSCLRRRTLVVNALVASASAYSLTKLLQEGWL